MTPAGTSQDGLAEMLRYPPQDPGIPLAAVDELFESQGKILTRLKIHAAAEPQIFDARFRQPIQRVAEYVSTLPATPDGLYSGPGGLLRACVELAFGSFQASDGRIFTGNLGVEQRHLLEVRWRYVCFLGGLLWPLGKTLECIKVASPSGVPWPARVGPIVPWSLANDVSRVYCNWPKASFEPGPASTASALALSILGEAPIAWLEAGSPHMTTALIGIASGVREESYGIAYDLVADMWVRVCAVEQARRPQTYGRVQFGHHLAPHLVDAMRSLLDLGVWAANKSPTLVDASGVFLIWPTAGEDLLKKLHELGVPGAPNSVGGLLSLLEDADLIRHDLQAGPFVEVADSTGELVEAVKLTRPTSLIEDYTPQAFANARAVAMDVIVREDPLAKPAGGQAQEAPVKRAPSPPKPGPDLLAPTLIPAASASEDESQVEEVPAAKDASQESIPASKAVLHAEKAQPTAEKAPVIKRPAATDETDRKVASAPSEGQEVRYAELLPADIRKQLKGFRAEQLGKLVHLLKDPDIRQRTRKLPTGLAVPMTTLTDIVSSPPDFLLELSGVGLLHIDPSTPGRRIYEVLIPEGSANKCMCFILGLVLIEKVGM